LLLQLIFVLGNPRRALLVFFPLSPGLYHLGMRTQFSLQLIRLNAARVCSLFVVRVNTPPSPPIAQRRKFKMDSAMAAGGIAVDDVSMAKRASFSVIPIYASP
jgi:hypothetical protein